MARRATVIRRERARSPHVLLLDAGDALFGSGVVDEAQGRAAIEAMNAMGYDAMALGERDFSLGVEALREFMAEAKFPMLSANIVFDETGQLLAQPYLMKCMGGHKISIIGLSSLEVAEVANRHSKATEAIVAGDPIEAAKEYVERVQKEANVIIVLSHLGFQMDQRLARQVPGIDVIVGGHERMHLYPPVEVRETGTLIVQAGDWGQYLGCLHLTVDGQGMVTDYTGELITLGPDIPDDPALKALVDRYRGQD